MPELDSKLKAGLQKAQNKTCSFVLVLSKDGKDGRLFVYEAAAPSADVKAAKAEFKVNGEYRGECQEENGKVCFRFVKAPAGSVEKTLQTIAKRDANLTIKAAVAEGPAPPKAVAPEGESLKDKLKEDQPKEEPQARKKPEPKEESSEDTSSNVSDDDESAAVDKELRTGLMRAKTQVQYFVVVVKGSDDGGLIVGKKPAKSGEINAVRKKCGGKKFYRGTCQGDGGEMVFTASRKCPPTLTKTIKVLAKRDANLTIKAALGGAPSEGDEWRERAGQMQEDLKAIAAAGHPEAASLMKLFAECTKIAQAGDLTKALALLDKLEPRIENALDPNALVSVDPPETDAPPESTNTVEDSGVDPTEPPVDAFDKMAFTKARLLWDQARKKVQADLRNLQSRLMQQAPDEADLAAGVGSVMEQFDETLLDVLDDAYSAGDATERRKHHRQALGIIRSYQALLTTDPLIQHIDKTPLAKLEIEKTFSKTLETMAGHLDA